MKFKNCQLPTTNKASQPHKMFIFSIIDTIQPIQRNQQHILPLSIAEIERLPIDHISNKK
jgi:fructose-1,6-bisphosphatase